MHRALLRLAAGVTALLSVAHVAAAGLEGPALVRARSVTYARRGFGSGVVMPPHVSRRAAYPAKPFVPPPLNATSTLFLDSPPDEIKFNDADPSVLFLVSRNQLMRSGDFGKTWKTYSDSDLPGLQPNTGEQGKGIRSFYRNDAHPNQVIVLGYGDLLWFSNDTGLHFTAWASRGNVFTDIVFHPVNRDLILASASDPRCSFFSSRLCASKLFYSTDLGQNWVSVTDKAYEYHWGWGGLTAGRDVDSIYYLTDRRSGYSPDRKELYKWNIDAGTNTFVLTDVSQFLPISSYFFVVSRPIGAPAKILVAWRDRPFIPTTFEGRDLSRIALLDASEDAIFALDLQRPNATKRNAANLYVSAEFGARYALSLRDVLYYESPLLVEFHKVQSLNGVFLANIVGDDYLVKTLVTYNKGGYWEAISRVQSGVSMPVTLSIGSFYESVPIMTGSYAPGMALAYGTTEPVEVSKLNLTTFDMMLSRNGGRYWNKILTGAFVCDATDEGNILLCVPEAPSNSFQYSLDKGTTFQTVKYGDKMLQPAGIFCDPVGDSLSCTVLTKGDEDNGFAVTPVDFGQLGIPNCTEGDYEMFSPTDGRASRRCVLGLSMGFARRKPESICVSSINRVPERVVRCPCEQYDFECDYGFGGSPCQPLDGFNITATPCNSTGYSYMASGYRRVPGNQCAATAANPDLSKPIEIECHSASNLGLAVGLGLTMPLIALAGAVGGIYYMKRRRASPYAYTTLATQTETDFGPDGEPNWAAAAATGSALLLPRGESDLADIDNNRYHDKYEDKYDSSHFDPLGEPSDAQNDMGAIPLESMDDMHIVSLQQ